MSFFDVATTVAQTKLTENGAVAYNTTRNSLLNLFGTIGALRSRSEAEITDKFVAAFAEDRLLATKMLFYAGNIRGGLGERRTFRICLNWLARNYPSIVIKNMQYIPLFNRWDSLFALVGTPCEVNMWSFITKQLRADYADMVAKKPCSLLAKWMPSENASSEKTKRLARTAIKYMGIPAWKYRKTLSQLRAHIRVVERDMSHNDWSKISYSEVPSYAMARYGCAFSRHDFKRFSEYIEALNLGKTKINASVLYPYNLVKNYLGYHADTNVLAEQQWKALPNYIEPGQNVLIMADVSGSMDGRPMETSIGLAIYFAEHNVGAYEGLYMTFTNKPHFISLEKGATLRKKCAQVRRTDVGYNTDLEGAFKYVLETAINNHVLPDEMPKAIIVISDMEIDRYMRSQDNYSWDFIEEMKVLFERAGYKLPKLCLWNVAARYDTFLSQSDDVLFVSGQSTSTFKTILSSLNGTSYDLMLNTLNDAMYDGIEV